MTGRALGPLLIGALLVALAVSAIWSAAFVPATDMPGHLYGAVARAHLDEREYGHFLDANRPPTANGLIDVFALLEPALGWRDAYRATATLLVVTWMLAAGALVLALDRRRAWLALLAASTAFGWSFYMGFWAYCAATALGFLTLALVLRAPAVPVARTRALLALVLLAVSVAHFFAAFLTGVVWLVIAVARAPRERRGAEALWTCACGVPAALVVVVAATGAVGAHDGLVEVIPLSLRFASWGEATMGGPWWRQAPLLVVMALSVVAAVLVRGRPPVERALVAVAALFLLVPLVVPWSAGGWQHLSPRPLPFAAALLCAALPVERAPRVARLLVAALCIVGAFASTWWARNLHRRASDDIADVLRAVDAPLGRAAGYRWPLVLVQPAFVDDASLFRWDPLRGAGNLFALTQGGFPGYAFANSPQSDAVLLKSELRETLAPPLFRSRFVTPVRTLEGDARAAGLDALASNAVRVDGVILLERPEDHAHWKKRGYVVDVEDGRVLLAHFEGCALDASGVTGKVSTRMAPATDDTLVRTDDVDTTGGSTARLEGLPCGLVEVRGCGPARTLELTRGKPAALACGPETPLVPATSL